MRIEVLLAAGLIGLVGLGGCSATEREVTVSDSKAASVAKVTVYKTPTCGCCGKWVEHLQSAGFSVEAIEVRETATVRAMNGVPTELGSCHTALVDGYVVEGHVPAQDVLRLLEERPPVLGLAVPGMPIGSPGMEGPNPERYEVFAFNDRGERETFATHGP